MALRIASYPGNPRVLKALLTAALNGVHVDYPHDFEMGKANKTEAFLAVNPFGQVPTLFDEHNHGVFESNSIARYVARLGEGTRKLYGKDALEASRIDSFLDAEFGSITAIGPWLFPLLGFGTANEEKTKESVEKTKKYLLGLNHALNGHHYLVGDSLSLADIVTFAASIVPYNILFTEEYLKDVPNYVSWYKRMTEVPEFAIHKVYVQGTLDRLKKK